MGYNQKHLQLFLPITIGTKPLQGNQTALNTTHGRPSTLSLPIEISIPIERESLPPELPDDDTVSIRTYASTPPPFPDDGKFNSLISNE